MHQNLREFVDVALPEVCSLSSLSNPNLIYVHNSMFLVWGFIWLVQAFVFFGLGVIVGLVAFKVCPPIGLFSDPNLKTCCSKVPMNKNQILAIFYLYLAARAAVHTR
jgi:hypothetical protein